MEVEDLTKRSHPSTKLRRVLPQKIRDFGWGILENTVHFLNGVLRRICGAKAEVTLRFKKLHSEKVHNCNFHLWLCLNQRGFNMDGECCVLGRMRGKFGSEAFKVRDRLNRYLYI